MEILTASTDGEGRTMQHNHAVFGCGGSAVLLLLIMLPRAHYSKSDAVVWVTDITAAAMANASACNATSIECMDLGKAV